MTNDWNAFKTLVYGFLSDVVPNDDIYTLAVAEYVKAKFAREVEHDLELHNSYMQAFMVYRQRLVGYKYSVVSDPQSALLAAVKKLITTDANRQGTADLLSGMITQAQADIEGMAVLVAALIRQGVIDIQSYIPIYRAGQNKTFTNADFTPEGKASKGVMPAGAQIRDAYFKSNADSDAELEEQEEPGAVDIDETPLMLYDWSDREDLFAGKAPINAHTFYLCLDPWGINFYIYPAVDENHSVKLTWDGLKVDFADADVVMPPFDEAMAQVVAEYVKGHIARDVARDYALAQMCLKQQSGTYYAKRRRLFLDALDRQRTREL